MLTLQHVTFSCDEPARLAEFWATLLEYETSAAGESVLAIDPRGEGTRLLFNRMPKSPTIELPIHVDVNVPDSRGRARTRARARRLARRDEVRPGRRARGNMDGHAGPRRERVLPSGSSSPVSFTVDNPPPVALSGSARSPSPASPSTPGTRAAAPRSAAATRTSRCRRSPSTRSSPRATARASPDRHPDDERNRRQPGRLPGRDADAAPDQQLDTQGRATAVCGPLAGRSPFSLA